MDECDSFAVQLLPLGGDCGRRGGAFGPWRYVAAWHWYVRVEGKEALVAEWYAPHLPRAIGGQQRLRDCLREMTCEKKIRLDLRG